MKKTTLIPLTSFIAAIFITRSDLGLSLVGFFMTGTVPGTNFTVPFWAMMALYCLGITVIVTGYIEEIFTFIKTSREDGKKKQHLPRRRYNNSSLKIAR